MLPPPDPTPIHIVVEHREPAPPPPHASAEKKPPVALAAPAEVRARFQRDLNHWEVVWKSPDGSAHTTVMSPGPFSAMIKRVMHENSNDQAAVGCHGLTIDNGTNATAVEIANQAFEGLTAYLQWYYEDTGH